ncbi:MAG: CDP-2,3-bis-(O-geranylgeranyl)-sn-glycerol synthase [Candidatus Hydrothermarchaeota archaeon]
MITFEDIGIACWFILPAYGANLFPVVAKGKRPIDMRKNWIDNRRLLGDGKTIEGTLSGILAAFLIGFLQDDVFLGLILGLGAITGDLFGSFIKRRLDLPQGSPFPIMDQLDFIAGALLFAAFFVELNIETVAIILIITPFLHLITNNFAYKFGFKDVRW